MLSLAGGEAAAVGMRLEGARGAVEGRGQGRPVGVSNYLSGPRESWVTGVPSFGSVRYDDAWPGIDVVYRGVRSGLEYDLVVAPGADPARIALGFDRDVAVDDKGDLVISTPGGPLRHEKPVAFQEVGGRRTPVAARFAVDGTRDVRFVLGRYDRTKPLVIDPAVVYSTFLGGPVGDAVNGIAVDGGGQAYVAGSTTSPDFPTVGAFQGTKGAGGTDDAFVTKFNPAGNGLVYSTFLGGGGADTANAIAIDAAGNAYVAGTTASTNFPTAAAIQGTKGAETDAFVAKVNPAGNGLVWSTFLGGAAADTGLGIRVDGATNVYVTGSTASTDFPTASPLQGMKGAATDAYVTKINAAGSALVYSTYLGGGGADVGNGIALDDAANAYVVGSTATG